MRHHRKLTDEDRRQIIKGRAEGASAAALAHRFGVSRRTIYNTLGKAKGAHLARTRTISTRVSARELAGFRDGLAKRGITDHPAALRCLMGAADKILMAPDPAMVATLNGWTAEIQSRGAAINQIARKLNEAKLRGHPLPYTDKDEAVMRAMMAFMVTFTADFHVLWGAKLEAMSREVDRALAGLEAKRLAVQ